MISDCFNLPAVYFGFYMCKITEIDTPECRIIEFNDKEYKIMFENIDRCSVGDNVLINKISSILKQKQFLLIYEYIPSLNIHEIGQSRSQLIFKSNNPNSRTVFMKIGKILALDLFLNNSNRLPWIWMKEGNPNNILFRINLELLPPNVNFKDYRYMEIIIENVVALFTNSVSYDPEDKISMKNLAEYINTLSEILKEFFYEMKNIILLGKDINTFEFRSFQKISDFINNSCGFKMEAINIFHIAIGFIIMINDLIKIELDDINCILNYIKDEAILQDWADEYKSKSKDLNINYFRYILGFLNQMKDEYQEIFNFVIDFTFDYYSINFKNNLNKILIDDYKLRNSEAMSKYISDNNIKSNDDVKSVRAKSKEDMNHSRNLSENNLSKMDDNKKILTNDNTNNILNKEINYDEFNNSTKDKKIFTNDVHNGMYDVIDLDPSLILEVKQREFKQFPEKKEYKEEMIFIPNKQNNDEKDEVLQDHKTFTMDELKEKVKKDELKDTIRMKKKFNPEEAKFIEDKIRVVDENILNDINN